LHCRDRILVGTESVGKGFGNDGSYSLLEMGPGHHPELERLFALPYADNLASRRVLEKAGYTLDAVLKRGAIRKGVIVDQALYSFLRPH